MSKIALAMICKGTDGEHLILDRALSTIAPYVDGIFITLTGETNKLKDAEAVCKKYNAHVSYTRAQWTATTETVDWLRGFFGYDPQMQVGDKLFLFDEARNFNFSQVPPEYDWILWIDADDVFRNGENLRKVADMGDVEGIEAIYFNYVYQAELDESLNVKHVLIEHLRERLVRNIGIYKWVSNIHETLIEQRPTRKTDNYDCSVLHLATHEDRIASLSRNLKSLELAIFNSQGKDPRHVYYLAKAFFDLNTEDYDMKTIPLIFQYLWGENKSGWPEERAQACEYLGEIYRRRGQLNNAVKSAMNALIEAPENPSIFLNLAVTYMLKQEWDRAELWLKLAAAVPDKKTTLVKNPKDLQVRALQVVYACHLYQGRIVEAWEACMKLLELLPEDQAVRDTFQFINNVRLEFEYTRDILKVAKLLHDAGESNKIKMLLSSVPKFLENNPDIQNLSAKHNPPTYWDKNSIVMYVGPGFTQWSSKSLADPRGGFVGGSEEAVIRMAESLVKQGWEVTVFGDPGRDEGVINGVEWLPYYKFNVKDHFNIFISWRQLGMFDNEIIAKKSYLWNHDIQNNLEYTPERMGRFTKAIFLSDWHRQNVPGLEEGKVLLSSNGI